jgi:hypothetical protein
MQIADHDNVREVVYPLQPVCEFRRDDNPGFNILPHDTVEFCDTVLHIADRV